MDKKLKIKLVIFIILSAVGVFLIAYTGVENNIKLKQIEENQTSQIKSLKEEKEKQIQIQQEEKEKENKTKSINQAALSNLYNKKYEQAIKLCEDAIEEDSKDYEAYNIKGISLCYLKQFKQGMEMIDKSLAIRPDFGFARFNKALGYELWGEYDKALEWYDKALQVENYEWSYYGKACIYAKRGDLDNTIANLSKAIELNPKIKDKASEDAYFNIVRENKKFNELLSK